jgi:hypothetical protein
MKRIFVCSKDNPIHVFDFNGNVVKTFKLTNHLEELINPICLKIDEYVTFII